VRKGFTILELLVASLLLGMLMTILTMVFNQSSIAWRTGVAGITDMRIVREKVSNVRYQADNAYPNLGGQMKCVQSVFDGASRTVRTGRGLGSFQGSSMDIKNKVSSTKSDAEESYEASVACGSATELANNAKNNYVINVMSAGPDGVMDTFDDIWSFPDDAKEWCDE